MLFPVEEVQYLIFQEKTLFKEFFKVSNLCIQKNHILLFRKHRDEDWRPTQTQKTAKHLATKGTMAVEEKQSR